MDMEIGFDWKGIRVVVKFNPYQPIYLGTLKALDVKNERPFRAIIQLGTKGLREDNLKFLISVLFHELGHVDRFLEIIREEGYGRFLDIVWDIQYGNRLVKLTEEREANVRAIKFLRYANLLDEETFLFLAISLSTYWAESYEMKERLIRLLAYLSRSPYYEVTNE